MLTTRPAADRGHGHFDWLDSRHTFSFADYHDPAWMWFRTLRVLNDAALADGDGVAASEEPTLTITTSRDAAVIVFDLA